MDTDADVLFEASWEVCNKVGGIHTVIVSKTALISQLYHDFYLIGPYFYEKTQGQFIEEAVPDNFKQAFEKLKAEGIILHYGHWLIRGNPKTILIDSKAAFEKMNAIKAGLWEDYGIDSLKSGYDFDEPVVWSHCVGRLIHELSKGPLKNKKVVSQFHEWLSGTALLYLKKVKSKVATVFTTHATMLGRTLAGSGYDLYNSFNDIDPQKKAYDVGVQDKYLMEQQCAKYCDIFTTVSEITGMEAKHLIGRDPDIILPNGLDIDKFPTFEDASIKHKHIKQQLYEYVMAHFFPYYSFDIKETLLFFLAGRYEYHTKGIDIFIESLGRLNEYMKSINSPKTILAFFFVPGDIKNTKQEIVEAKSYFNDVKEYIINAIPDVQNTMIYSFLADKEISKESLFSKEFSEENTRRVLRFKRQGLPPICTHDLNNEENDQIVKGLKQNGLTNKEEDKVKAIYYPIYLTGADGLLDTDYYETILGCHLGVFPSYYEPWGYTPLEAGALGIAAITTDLSGFGMYVKNEVNAIENPGIYVLDRLNKNDSFVAENMTDLFKKYIELSKRERIENKINARKIAGMADWKTLINEYINAHNMAIRKIHE